MKKDKNVNINININVHKEKPKTQVAVIMDRSSSMESIQKATVDGFNEYIDTLKKKGGDYEVSLTFFDTETERAYTKTSLQKVNKLTEDTYKPNGWTALYDGVGETIEDLKRNTDEGAPALIVIITDGGENSSKKFDQRRIADLIKAQEKNGWTFIFIGANQDSWATAKTFGLTSTQNVVNFNATARGANAMFKGLGSSNIAYMSRTEQRVNAGLRGSSLNDSSFFDASTQASIENTK